MLLNFRELTERIRKDLQPKALGELVSVNAVGEKACSRSEGNSLLT